MRLHATGEDHPTDFCNRFRARCRSVVGIAFKLDAGPVNSTVLSARDSTTSQPEQPEAGANDDPTRAVFFRVREEYRNLKVINILYRPQ